MEGSDFCAKHRGGASASVAASEPMETIDESQSLQSLSMAPSLAFSLPVSIPDSVTLDKLAELSHKLNVLEQMMKTMMVAFTSNPSTTSVVMPVSTIVKPRRKHVNMTDAGVRRKAKFIFYNEYKSNPALLDTLKNRLSTAGLLKYKKVGDADVMDVPWSLIKQTTDAEFDGLSEEDKMTWYAKVVRPSVSV